MANGFTVNALLDASKWLRGAKDMQGTLDDLEGALDDAAAEVQRLDRAGEQAFESLGDAADDAGDGVTDFAKETQRAFSNTEKYAGKAADEIEKIGKESKSAFNKLEDGADDAKDEVSDLEKKLRSVRDTADDVGDKSAKSFDKAKEGVSEFKDEANSTAREAAASFDGSAESIGDAFQEVAANAFSGFGPAGAVAGIAAALGLGAVTAAFDNINAEAEASAERASEWADAFISSGGRIIDSAHTVAEIVSIATDAERYKQAGENATNWGVDVSTAMRAMAGDAAALEVVQQSLNERGDQYSQILKDNVTGSGASYDKMNELTEAEKALIAQHDIGIGAWNQLNGEMETGAQIAVEVSNALIGVVNDASSATKEVDQFGNELYTLPDGTEVVVSADTGLASQNVSSFKGDLDGVPETVTSTVKIDVDDWAVRNWSPPIFYTDVVARPSMGNVMY